MDPVWATASEIAQAVNAGTLSATTVVEETLGVIAARDPLLNAFTSVTDTRARKRAEMLDSRRAQGQPLGPLAGVPFAVKNLFDVAGLPTLAGSKINRELAARGPRCAADRTPGSRRRDSGRRAQHGRIRLRLHRRERALRSLAQPA